MQKSKTEESQSRGDKDTQTNDARFDQSFKFAHGLAQSTPWYAQTNTKTNSQRHLSKQ